jgi:hypothetical protein
MMKEGEDSDEEVQILAGKKPANYDELLERQEEAERKYKENLDQTKEKYKGLTLKQKKELAEEELKEKALLE